MGGSQGHAGRLWAVSRGESFVMIHPTVVVTRGSKADQACDVTRDAGKRTMQKVVIGIQSHELGRVAHRVLGRFDARLVRRQPIVCAVAFAVARRIPKRTNEEK